jgi:hypothetical protein
LTPYRSLPPSLQVKEPLRLNLRKRLLTSPITGVFFTWGKAAEDLKAYIHEKAKNST